VDLTQAFTLLRHHARATDRRLSDLAHDVVTGTTTIDAVRRPRLPP
jgi:hypothetical protein